jgi:hypothetical protein
MNFEASKNKIISHIYIRRFEKNNSDQTFVLNNGRVPQQRDQDTLEYK